MKIPKKVVETIEVKYVRFHTKMRDGGTYILLDPEFNELKERDGYVPSFFPYGRFNKESNNGDYVDLFIDLETGQVVNWKKDISPEEVAISFELIEREE